MVKKFENEKNFLLFYIFKAEQMFFEFIYIG